MAYDIWHMTYGYESQQQLQACFVFVDVAGLVAHFRMLQSQQPEVDNLLLGDFAAPPCSPASAVIASYLIKILSKS